MEFKTKTRTEQILTVMNIVAWVAFIGFMVEAGAILVSFCVTFINPDAAKHLYKGLNWYNLWKFSFWHYTLHAYLMVLLSMLKAFVWYLIIKVVSKINLVSPFNMEVVIKLEKISYVLLATWIVALLSSAHSNWLLKATGEQYGNDVSGESIFVAGLVFIISQVFKRGVEIQSENELTI
ncbi:MAG TPA: DUF2975 domain-containing protein [Mucilaginibacter sp.]|jgi:hypothetical protein